jgi:hypothetical protein
MLKVMMSGRTRELGVADLWEQQGGKANSIDSSQMSGTAYSFKFGVLPQLGYVLLHRNPLWLAPGT